jgi:hypothetical protein
MLLNDYYKTYKMNESEDTFMIEKNNDAQYYDILESINELSNDTFCVLNHLYVNEDKESQFEDKFLGRQKHLQDVPGFKALRFLRPQAKHKQLYYSDFMAIETSFLRLAKVISIRANTS